MDHKDPIMESCESEQTLQVSTDPEPRSPEPSKDLDQSDISTQPQTPSEKFLVSTDSELQNYRDPSGVESLCESFTTAAADTEEDQSAATAQVSQDPLGSDTATRSPAVQEGVQLNTEEGIQKQHLDSAEAAEEFDYELVTSLDVLNTGEDQTSSPGCSKTVGAHSGRVSREETDEALHVGADKTFRSIFLHLYIYLILKSKCRLKLETLLKLMRFLRLFFFLYKRPASCVCSCAPLHLLSRDLPRMAFLTHKHTCPLVVAMICIIPIFP